jgi:hypothetical protein
MAVKTDDKIALALEHIAKLSASVSAIMASQAQIISHLTGHPVEDVMRTLADKQAEAAQAVVDQLYEKYPSLLNDDKK